METVLEVYQRPEYPAFPVVAMDERPVQLLEISETPCLRSRDASHVWITSIAETENRCVLSVYRSLSRVSTRLRAANRYRLGGGSQALLDDTYPDAVRVTLVCDNQYT